MKPFDIEAYRAHKASVLPLASIHEDVVAQLSNAQNIELWKEGIIKPNFEGASDAFAHYEGFRRTMVNKAAETASSTDNRFVANDLEFALEPSRVAKYITSLSGVSDQEALRQKAALFLTEQLSKASLDRAQLNQHRFNP